MSVNESVFSAFWIVGIAITVIVSVIAVSVTIGYYSGYEQGVLDVEDVF